MTNLTNHFLISHLFGNHLVLPWFNCMLKVLLNFSMSTCYLTGIYSRFVVSFLSVDFSCVFLFLPLCPSTGPLAFPWIVCGSFRILWGIDYNKFVLFLWTFDVIYSRCWRYVENNSSINSFAMEILLQHHYLGLFATHLSFSFEPIHMSYSNYLHVT